MELIHENGLDKLVPAEGMFIATKALDNVFESYIYLGIYDSIDNYVEVDQKTRDEIIARQEAEAKEMMERPR